MTPDSVDQAAQEELKDGKLFEIDAETPKKTATASLMDAQRMAKHASKNKKEALMTKNRSQSFADNEEGVLQPEILVYLTLNAEIE